MHLIVNTHGFTYVSISRHLERARDFFNLEEDFVV